MVVIPIGEQYVWCVPSPVQGPGSASYDDVWPLCTSLTALQLQEWVAVPAVLPNLLQLHISWNPPHQRQNEQCVSRYDIRVQLCSCTYGSACFILRFGVPVCVAAVFFVLGAEQVQAPTELPSPGCKCSCNRCTSTCVRRCQSGHLHPACNVCTCAWHSANMTTTSSSCLQYHSC